MLPARISYSIIRHKAGEGLTIRSKYRPFVPELVRTALFYYNEVRRGKQASAKQTFVLPAYFNEKADLRSRSRKLRSSGLLSGHSIERGKQ